MPKTALWMTAFAIAAVSVHAHAATPGATAAAPCSAAVYRQFDFWLGDWDTYDADAPHGPSVARNRVDAILGGCALREDYRQNDGLQGQSFTVYDASRQLWHQTWVTNRGSLLVLEGRKQGERIVLNGIDHAHGDALVRASWAPVGGNVREIATQSRDGGKTWQPLFDIEFRPHGT